MANSSVFMPITKAEKRDDGTMVVVGKATGPDLDIDNQICDPKWLASAMPEWMKWGNVREQHTSIAAGVGLSLEQVGDDWHLESLVVDPGSVRKVDAGVLKGYSVGIRNPKIVKDASAPGGRIVGGQIVEISLVDRPANPSCTLALAKTAKIGGPLELVQVADADVSKMVVQENGKWCVRSEDGETLFGCYPTKGEAEQRLAQVEYFKHNEKAAGVDMGVEKAADMMTGEEGAEVETPEQEQEETDYIDVARQALAAWLVSEAQEVVSNTGTVAVVQIIANLLCDLEWAEECDEFDDMAVARATGMVKSLMVNTTHADAEVESVNLSTVADLVKAASADTATDEERVAVSELRKALGIDSLVASVEEASKSVTDAITKASALKEPIAGFEKRLAQVEAMAAPGGPVRTRTDAETTKAANNERAAELERLAAAVVDTDLKQGYLALAADARKEYTA